jgi:nicotinate-nucleotide adenylyltransferase
MSQQRTVALLGGSFDPPHIGHVLMASWALCLDEVQEVWLLPTFIHPFGKSLSAYDARCEMCEAAIAHLGPAARVERIEQELGGVSYTVRTLEALSHRDPDVSWRWVGGADTWNQRHTWREWDRLETMVEPLIIGREGAPTPAPFTTAPVLPDISSSEIRSRVAADEDIGGLVPVEVLQMIQRRGLYR